MASSPSLLRAWLVPVHRLYQVEVFSEDRSRGWEGEGEGEGEEKRMTRTGDKGETD